MQAEAIRAAKRPDAVDTLRSQLRVAIDGANRQAASGEYRRTMEENGGIDMSAGVPPTQPSLLAVFLLTARNSGF